MASPEWRPAVRASHRIYGGARGSDRYNTVQNTCRTRKMPTIARRTCCLVLLLAAAVGGLQFQLDAPGRGPRVPPGTRQVALYPLPAVYLPGSQCMVRNIEQRNLAMCREQSEFVAAYVASDRSSCASIGSLLRIDDVRPAARDNSGMVLAAESTSNVLEVRCTVVGRVRLVACENLEAWRRPERDQYLLADVAAYEDEDEEGGEGGEAKQDAEKVEDSREAADESDDDEWWMGAAAAGDVANAIYQLVDALFESAGADGMDTGVDVDATVASLERAAELAEEADWWGALDLWQMYCATRLAGASMLHRTERNEFIIDAKMREGGEIQIPVRESTLAEEDRVKLADLDRRAADAVTQMGLDDARAFQACLEARRPSERARSLLRGVQSEAERLARRAALQRALDVS